MQNDNSAALNSQQGPRLCCHFRGTSCTHLTPYPSNPTSKPRTSCHRQLCACVQPKSDAAFPLHVISLSKNTSSQGFSLVCVTFTSVFFFQSVVTFGLFWVKTPKTIHAVKISPFSHSRPKKKKKAIDDNEEEGKIPPPPKILTI